MCGDCMNKGLDFDDVLLVPRGSTVNSRKDVDLSVGLGNDLVLDIPIIASPMKGITGVELVKSIAELGGIGILHRFYTDLGKRHKDIKYLKNNAKCFGIATWLSDLYWKEALGLEPDIICIDVANGYLDSVLKFAERISAEIANNNYKTLLMAGNIATAEGARNLSFSGVDLIRVGIGSGNLCTTRNVTGVGVPQLTALNLANSINDIYDTFPIFIADGGIKNSGDAVKALAFGADVVMLGSLLATTYESTNNGIIYGMASRKMQEEYYHSIRSVEGIEQQITPKQTLSEFIDEFTWGIRSACTYLNALNLSMLKGAYHVEITPNAIKKF